MIEQSGVGLRVCDDLGVSQVYILSVDLGKLPIFDSQSEEDMDVTHHTLRRLFAFRARQR